MPLPTISLLLACLVLFDPATGKSGPALEKPSRAWETIPVVPHVSGLRIEDLPHPAPKAFLGYTDAGETIVEPDTAAVVIVFGYWLQKVEYLAFTDSNCITAEFTVAEEAFIVQTERRIELSMSFPDVDESWRICVKQKGEFGELLLVDDIRTWITTTATIPQHFLPLSAQIIIVAILFSLSALFSGLNLGLMSLSIQELQLIINSGSPQEARFAASILPIRRRGNYLLCTILIMNVVVNSAISILFEDLTSGTVAFILASFGIVVLGEILPQSICVKNGLAVGARTIFLTKFFMLLTLPLALPISKLLDCLLGEEVERYDRKRLIEILKMQTKNENKEFAADLKIAVGAIEIANKRVREAMTRIDDAFMIPEDEVLNSSTVAHILKKGYTRIPVYEDADRNRVRSLLFVKDLALVNLKSNVKVKEVAQLNAHILRVVPDNMMLTDLLEEFKKGDYHLAMVEAAPERVNAGWVSERLAEFKENDCSAALLDSRHVTGSSWSLSSSSSTEEVDSAERADEVRPLREERPSTSRDLESSPEGRQLVGLITLEDIIEEILQAEIIDESDTVMDNSHRLKRRHANSYLSVMLDTESRAEQLMKHTLDVVVNWLQNHLTIFDDAVMDEGLLRKLIQCNIRQVNASTKAGNIDRHRIVQIFNVGVSSKRAILILEGSLEAFFPHSGMHFPVGPWTAFGDSLLTRCHKELTTNNRVSTLAYTPDFTLETKSSCKFLQLPFASVVHALKVSQFIRTISPDRQASATKSEEMAGMKAQAKTRQKSSEIHLPRKLSDFTNRSTRVSSKKSVAF